MKKLRIVVGSIVYKWLGRVGFQRMLPEKPFDELEGLLYLVGRSD